MADRLSAIRVRNYRCFREPFRLELRPLTLVYGWNNAGKSAAVRLVRLLGDSLRETARAPLDPTDSTYRDLVWKPAVTDPGPLRFELEWTGTPVRTVSWRFDLDREAGRMYVREMELTEGGATLLHLRALRPKAPDLYEVVGQSSKEATVRFSGLVPSSDVEALAVVAERLRGLRGATSHLSGDRITPPPFVPEGKPPPVELAPTGAGATELLLADDDLFDAAREWFARPPIGRRLARRVQELTGRLLLSPSDAPFEIELTQCGAGMGQVLPVLAAVARARLSESRGDQAIVAIEEPESQLHPNAQRALGDWFCEVAAHDPAPRLVLETHSRVLVLAIQLAIASGRLDPSRVGIYWLEQRTDGSTAAELVELDPFGRPGRAWPRDAFADELELAELLAAKQFEKGAWGTPG